MKKIRFVLLMLSLISFSQLFAQDQEQRIRASYLLAFNKSATDGEVNYWKTQGNLSMSQLLARHKQYIVDNPQQVYLGILQGSYTEAFGKAITDAERNYHMQYPRTYVEIMSSHMQYLKDNPSLYDEVIRESYRSVFGKGPSEAELNYWRGQPKVAFIWLFRAHLEYLQNNRRNTVSIKGNGTVKVSPSVLAETRSAVAGLVGTGLVGNDGASLVAAGAGNLIGNDGSTLVAAGSLN